MKLLCRIWSHRWSGPALTSSIDGHMTRYCTRCKTRITVFTGFRALHRHVGM